jgi:hypothetical protein
MWLGVSSTSDSLKMYTGTVQTTNLNKDTFTLTNTTNSPSYTIGTNAYFGLATASSSFLNSTIAGDIILKNSSTNNSIICGFGTSTSLSVNNTNVSISTTANSSSSTTGALTVAGGVGITGNLYTGGNINVTGTISASNLASNTLIGTANVGAYNGTGVKQVAITFATTMSDTNYNLSGSVNTTTNSSDVYVVNFTNLSTTGITANIFRIDNLSGGWSDTNLRIDYTVLY